jgi:DNA-packaging protein gp3
MPAPKGNQFWKLRSKHGRDKLFKDPELLWETACEYFQWIDEHPWIKNEQVKTAAKPIIDNEGKANWPPNLCEIPTARPYTLSGLCLYLDCDEHTLRAYGKDEDKKDFFPVIHAIERTVETQQIEGAMVGAFSAAIVASKLGLANKTDITSAGKEVKQVFIIGGKEIEI